MSGQEQATTDQSITAQIVELDRLSAADLRLRMQELTDRPCRQTHRQYLIKRLAFLIQERHYGGLSEEAKEQIASLQAEFEGSSPASWFTPKSQPEPRKPGSRAAGGRDPRLPVPGTALRRRHRDTEHTVVVGENDFTYAGQRFRSLSAVARAICGCHINGFAFFGLSERKAR